MNGIQNGKQKTPSEKVASDESASWKLVFFSFFFCGSRPPGENAKLLLKLRIPQEQEVGRIDQDIRGESFHSPRKQYHKAKSSDVSESTDEQPSDTVWTNAESI